MADQKLELEIALRDSVSLTLKAIAANVEEMNRKLSRGGTAIAEGTDTLKRLEFNVRSVGTTAKDSTKSLMGMNDILKQMTMFLSTGPLGMAAGLVAGTGMVAKIMVDYSKSRLDLRRMSQDTGLSEDQISISQRTYRRMGLPWEEANKNITRMATSLKELQQYEGGSDLAKSLSDIGEGKFWQETLLPLMRAGREDEAYRELFKKYDELQARSAEAARLYANYALKIPESFLEGYIEASKGIAPAYRTNLQYAEQWTKEWELLCERLRNAGNWFLRRALRGFFTSYWRRPSFGIEVGRNLPPIITDPKLRESLRLNPLTKEQLDALGETKKDSLKTQRDIGTILQNMWDKSKEAIGRQEGGPVTSGNRYIVGERGPELFSGGGRYALVGEGGPEPFRPQISGTVTKADLTEALLRAEAGAREWQPKAPTATDVMLGMFAPGMWGRVLTMMKNDPARGDVLRTIMRRYLGIEDPKEPAPWLPGGAWDQARAGIDGEGRVADVSLGGSIDFRNVPPGVRTEAESDGLDEFAMSRSMPVP